MPLFEYMCAACAKDFELLVRGSEQPACPRCGGTRLEKLLSVPAAHVQSGANSLPVCSPPRSAGGCGAPQCGQGMCGMRANVAR